MYNFCYFVKWFQLWRVLWTGITRQQQEWRLLKRTKWKVTCDRQVRSLNVRVRLVTSSSSCTQDSSLIESKKRPSLFLDHSLLIPWFLCPFAGLDPYNARLGTLGLLLLRTEVRIKSISPKADWFCLVVCSVVCDSYWVSCVALNWLISWNFRNIQFSHFCFQKVANI